MLKMTLRCAALLAVSVCFVSAQSFYPERLEDKTAVYLMHDGAESRDDTADLQKAIDKVADTTRQGIVFVPSGRYRITHTVYVWPGVRLIGYGSQRPIFWLPPNTEGYASGPAYMIVFAGGRTGERRMGGMQPANGRTVPQPMPFPGTVPPQVGIVDANPGTFYSAMSNINVEVGESNPGAVAIRFHVAQHCFLTHMEFRMGSAMAALQDIGNEAEDLHFVGGRYGIITGRPSPGWQFTLLDSTFEGQKEAAIEEHEAGLALIHDMFRNVPTAINIEDHHIDELWIENSRFEDIKGPAVTISRESSRLTEINFMNIVCHEVPVFAKLRESGKEFAGKGDTYRVVSFVHGLSLDAPKVTVRGHIVHDSGGEIITRSEVEALGTMPPDVRSAIIALPSQTGWANAKALGAKGDGSTDDTAALQHAVDTHRIVYLPGGRYRLTDTLRLKPDSVLIGLHPSTTQLDLDDNTPGFSGAGPAKALLLAPSGGANVVTGIGVWTGGSNNLAAAVMWMSGKDSLLDDVRFLGGHGTNNPDGSRMNPYNSSHGGDPNPLYRWDAQYPSLWVTNGGGTFADIWTPDTFSQAGLYVSDTKTEGHVYELSSEHHVRNEAMLRRVANWELVALQTEEERGEGGNCLPLSIRDSENITVAEMHGYRVVSSFTPFAETIHVTGSRNVRFRNLHIYSDSKVVFDSSVRDDDSDRTYRELEIASLTLGQSAVKHDRAENSPVVKRVAAGFFNASSLTAAPDGRVYFVDTVKQHIYRFIPESGRTNIISDAPIDPANLFFDKSGNMMIVSYNGRGTVYVTKPDNTGITMQMLKPERAVKLEGVDPVLPIDHWRFDQERKTPIGSIPKPWQYVSPDRSLFLPAGDDFVEGTLYYGTKMADVLRAFGLRPARPGQTFYVTDEGQEETYAGHVNEDGSLSDVREFVNRGGEGVTVGPDGLVYLAAGQVYAYTPSGRLVEEIDVPERPTGLTFSGQNGRTLYILARTSLYAVDRSVTK